MGSALTSGLESILACGGAIGRNAASVPVAASGAAATSRGDGADEISIGAVTGGSGSITGAPSMLESGWRHSKPPTRPVTGEAGSQRSDTYPSAVQAGSGAALTARAVHSRARP